MHEIIGSHDTRDVKSPIYDPTKHIYVFIVSTKRIIGF